jgi:replication factor A1
MLYQVKDLQQGVKRVNIVLKLRDRLEPRYAKGYKIVNFVAADATGTILIPFWNNDGDTVKVGEFIEIQNGYVSEFKGKAQLNIGKFGSFKKVEPPETFEVSSGAPLEVPASEEGDEPSMSLEQFLYQKGGNASLRLFMKEKVAERMVHTKLDGDEHRVVTYRVGDSSGCILFNMWDDVTNIVEVGKAVAIKGAYLKIFRGQRYLNLGRAGSVLPVEGTVKFNDQNDFSEDNTSSEGS